jgi:hypothetical protein
MIEKLEGYLWGVDGSYEETHRDGYPVYLVTSEHRKLLDVCLDVCENSEITAVILTDRKTYSEPGSSREISGLSVIGGTGCALLPLRIDMIITDINGKSIVVKAIEETEKAVFEYIS